MSSTSAPSLRRCSISVWTLRANICDACIGTVLARFNGPMIVTPACTIVSPGTGLGWKMTPQEDGRIAGRLDLRKHIAIVDITYTAKAFSITYADSTNLKYDGRLIHRNYNNWIKNLESRIQATIGAL